MPTSCSIRKKNLPPKSKDQNVLETVSGQIGPNVRVGVSVMKVADCSTPSVVLGVG